MVLVCSASQYTECYNICYCSSRCSVQYVEQQWREALWFTISVCLRGQPGSSESISISVSLFALLCFTLKVIGGGEPFRLDAVVAMRFHIHGAL